MFGYESDIFMLNLRNGIFATHNVWLCADLYESDISDWLLVSIYLRFCKINKIWIQTKDATRNPFKGWLLFDFANWHSHLCPGCNTKYEKTNVFGFRNYR